MKAESPRTNRSADQKRTWRELLRELDYANLSKLKLANSSDGNDEIALYAKARALVALGLNEEARTLIDAHLSTLAKLKLETLLNAQIAAGDFSPDLEQRYKALIELRAEFRANATPADPYLLGECNATLGFLCHQMSQFKSGNPFLEDARSEYLRAGLPGHAAITVFNLMVSANHCNDLERLEIHESEFRHLASLGPARDFLRLLETKWRAYRLIDGEDFGAALAHLREAAGISRALMRLSDLKFVLTLQAYTELKLGLSSEFVRSCEAFAEIEKDPGTPLFALMQEMTALSQTALIDERTAKASLARWNKLQIPAIGRLLLMELLLGSLLRSSHFDACVVLSRRCRKYSEHTGQAIPLVDLRYYEILALWNLGESRKAAPILRAYLSDARRRGTQVRIERIQRELARLSEAPASQPAPKNLGQSDIAGCAQEAPSNELTLIPEQALLVLGDREIPLKDSPLIQRLFELLIHYREGFATPELFERIYGVPYSPIRHLSRTNSLIERARKLVGTATILRTEGEIRLAPSIDARIVDPRRVSPERRRQEILGYIRTSSRPVPISEIQRRFMHPRRTLQLDLETLCKESKITRHGRFRAAAYEAHEFGRLA